MKNVFKDSFQRKTEKYSKKLKTNRMIQSLTGKGKFFTREILENIYKYLDQKELILNVAYLSKYQRNLILNNTFIRKGRVFDVVYHDFQR